MSIQGPNVAAVLHSVNDLRVEEVPLPDTAPNDVLVGIRSVGICGSDVHYWTHGRIGPFVVREPMILGHESAGVVLKVGKGVTSLQVGDRVALEPGVPCRYCSLCKQGRYNLCKDVKFFATPPVHGSMARFVVHPSDFCYKLPSHVSFDEGAMLEPLSVAVHACRRANIGVGSSVLVVGSGPVGLLCLMVAKAAGATRIHVIDIKEERLAVARAVGADSTWNDTKSSLTAAIQQGSVDPFQCVIEASGSDSGIINAIRACESGGTVVLVGLGKPEVTLPIVEAATREIDIRGIFRYANAYQHSLELVSSGKINVKPLITHSFILSEAKSAFEVAKNADDGAIKVTVKIS